MHIYLVGFFLMQTEIKLNFERQGCYFLYNGIYRHAAGMGWLLYISNIWLDHKFSDSVYQCVGIFKLGSTIYIGHISTSPCSSFLSKRDSTIIILYVTYVFILDFSLK